MRFLLPQNPRHHRLFRVWFLLLPIATGAPAASTVNAAAASAPPTAWVQLYDADAARFAANLRLAGFPEVTVGLLVSHEINTRFEAEERRLIEASQATDNIRKLWDPAHRVAWLQLQREKSRALRTALGTAPGVRATTDALAVEFPDLTPEARAALADIFLDYQQLEERVLAESKGHLLEMDLAMLTFLHEERSADLRQHLEEDRLIDLLIRRTRLGAILRSMLQCFDATPVEWRDCYRAGEKLGWNATVFQSGSIRVFDHFRELDEELGRTWSAERVAMLLRARRLSYRSTYQLVERLGQPRETVEVVHDSYLSMLNALLERHPPDAGMPRRFALRHELSVPIATGVPLPPKPFTMTKKEREQFVLSVLDTHLAEVRDALGVLGYDEYCTMNDHWISRMRQGVTVINELM